MTYQNHGILKRFQTAFDEEKNKLPLKSSTQKHFDIFLKFLFPSFGNNLAQKENVLEECSILTGYQPGRPPKVGILIYHQRVLYFCQKSRFRETIVMIERSAIASTSIAQCLKVTTLSFCAHGIDLSFVTRDEPRSLADFVCHLNSQSK